MGPDRLYTSSKSPRRAMTGMANVGLRAASHDIAVDRDEGRTWMRARPAKHEPYRFVAAQAGSEAGGLDVSPSPRTLVGQSSNFFGAVRGADPRSLRVLPIGNGFRTRS